MYRYLLLFLLCFFHSRSFAQTFTDTKLEAEKILHLADKFHVHPSSVDDSLSAFVFDHVLEKFHENGVLLLDKEMKLLSPYRLLLDDELEGNAPWEFLVLADSLFKIAMERESRILQKLSKNAFQFEAKEKYTPIKYRSVKTFATEKDLEENTRLWFKYRLLNDILSEHEEAGISDYETFLVTEPASRKEIAESEIEYLDYYVKDQSGAILSEFYLNHLASYFDPHTMYFSEKEKKSFEQELSSEDFRFGISLVADESGYVIIDQLEPGGAAWRSNKLNKGDRIIKLQWENEKAVDVSEFNLDQVHEFLQREDKMELTFTVKKPNGTRKVVVLKKEKVALSDDLVKSYILTGEKKVGYISLPDFYSGWEGDSQKGCANDVAKEILKLQKENIEGIILDLRNNGGGSLNEALSLAGIFIQEGQLAVIYMRNNKPVTLKDENRGTVYNGPLIVMINGQSASASEILSASLQDHRRALIVGQTSYGKSTGQTILPLDSTLTLLRIANQDFAPNDAYLKLTLSKLYRIKGNSAQKTGVIPDVLLPDFYSGFYLKEMDHDRSLSSDSVLKKTYFTPLAEYPLAKLNEQVTERMKSNTDYQLTLQAHDSILLILEETKKGVELNYDSYSKRFHRISQLTEKLSARTTQENTTYSISNTAYEEQILQMDEYYRELNQEVLKDLSGDIQLIETFRIMNDLLNFTKK